MRTKPSLIWSLCVLVAASPVRAAPCFVVPLAGAKARADKADVLAPTLAHDCSSLRVSEGSVRVIYTDSNGDSHTPLVKANEPFNPTDASDKQALKTIEEQMRPRAIATGTPLGPKGFQTVNPDVIKYGLPFQIVYLPADGLSFQLSSPSGASYSIIGSDRRTVVSGNAADPVRLLRSTFTPAGNYQFVLNLPSGPLSSPFSIAEQADTDDVEAALRKIDPGARDDPRVYAIARGLVFEDKSMSFNRFLAVKEVNP